MAVWLIRAGSHGEYEQKFIQENRVYVTWDGLAADLSKLQDKASLVTLLAEHYPDSKPNALQNWARQLWPFAYDMKIGDIVVLPLKSQPAIQVAEIIGDYHFEPNAEDPYFHWRAVKWIGEAVPRTHFGQDLLYSFGAFLTICRIQRNNAEQRIAAMRANDWKPETIASVIAGAAPVTDETSQESDLEELARDQIAQLIGVRFKAHNLTRLVEGILKAQGYTTYLSPEGPDGGVDILAGSGALGFGLPRLCVEVKSESAAIGREAVDKLLGAMTKFNAQEGLFVAWGGFKGNVQKELASQFFRLRLWTQKELLAQIFALYDQLDEELKAELPLKRVWMVATQEDT